MGKISTGISLMCGIIATILLVGYVIPSNNERLESAQRDLDEASLNLIDECANPANWDSGVELCKDGARQIQERCQSSPSMKVCSDPRIDLLINNPDEIEGRQAWKNHVNSLTIKLIDICQNDFVSDCYDSLYDLKQKCASTVYVPACDDPRIEKLMKSKVVTMSNESPIISEQTTMSQECRELKEIIEQNRWGYEHNDLEAIMDSNSAGQEYHDLGCP